MKLTRSHPSRAARSARAALQALTSSAVALAGIDGGARADSPPEQISASYAYTSYSEDGIESSKLAPGSEDSRYDIQMQQLSLVAPLFERLDIGLSVTHETMSGATPWFVLPDANGDAIQVMSGASGLATEVEDDRTDVILSTNYYLSTGRVGGTFGFSNENDYRSISGGINAERSLFSKNLTLSGALGFSSDEIEPTDSDLFPTRPDSEDKRSISALIGFSQLLDRFSTAQLNLSYKNSSGYLSDPYKLAFIQDGGGSTVADSRPDRRNQWAMMLRYRRHLERLGGSLHADYRFAWDDWGIRAHNIELAWHQPIWRGLRIVPSVRYYAQSAADFYSPFYLTARPDGYHSSDYRLSAYGAFGFGLRAEALFHTPWTGDIPWTAALALERYISDSDYALVDVDIENPGLVSFTVLSFTVGSSF